MNRDERKQPVRMALHGYGFIGRFHVLASHLNLASGKNAPPMIWDTAIVRSMDAAAAELATTSFDHVTTDVTALASRDIDAISIASPNDSHLQPFEYAVNNSLAVYCEKPISHSLDEARNMAEMVSQHATVNQVALVYRFHPAVMQARDWLASGRLGRVLNFRAELLHGGYLNAARPMSWRLDMTRSGGGAAMDLGIHLVDLLLSLLGPISEVSATTRTFVPERLGETIVEQVLVDDWTTAMFTMASGAVGTMEVSRVHVGRERDFLDIVCEGGVMHLPLDQYEGVSVHPVRSGIEAPEANRANVLQPFDAKFAQSTLLNLHATSLAVFATRVRGGEIDMPVPTVADGLAAQQAIAAVLESGRHGKAIHMDVTGTAE